MDTPVDSTHVPCLPTAGVNNVDDDTPDDNGNASHAMSTVHRSDSGDPRIKLDPEQPLDEPIKQYAEKSFNESEEPIKQYKHAEEPVDEPKQPPEEPIEHNDEHDEIYRMAILLMQTTHHPILIWLMMLQISKSTT